MKKLSCEILKAIVKYRPMSREICLTCKGSRMLCGRPSCPLLAKISIQSLVKPKLKESLFGPSPSIFVGHSNYPKVFVGPLTSIEDENSQILDDPAKWYGLDFEEIIKLRSILIRGKTRHNVREKSKFVEKAQEVALSFKPIDTEVHFQKKPNYTISFSPISQPLGPTAELKNFEIAENPRIPKKVDTIVDEELKATKAIAELYSYGFDIYYITRVFSSGALGEEQRRKLVPTRWSITAIDDIVGKFLISQIKNYKEIADYHVYSNTYLHNHFEVLLMPGKWRFELFEAWAPNTLWTLAYTKPAINVEREGYRGRTTYAISEGGGYYATRLAVAEGLSKMRKQASVVVFREIYEGYIMPVGVWEVRENVRRALKKKPEVFSTLKEALESIRSRLKLPLEEYLKRSQILTQTKLDNFLLLRVKN